MADVPISFPFGGLSDNLAASNQEPGTTREALNVRGTDPVTNRVRGAQRSGRSRSPTTQVDGASAPVKALAQVASNKSNLTYTPLAEGALTTEWSKVSPGGVSTLNAKTDSYGNVYFVDLQGNLCKRNSDGVLLWSVALPRSSSSNIVRALYVDSETRVFVAESEGVNNSAARMWMFRQLDDNQVEQVWQITPGYFTEDIVVRGAFLYAGQNNPTSRLSRVAVYSTFDVSNPTFEWETQAGYPITGLDCSHQDNMVYVCGSRNPTRPVSPTSPVTSPTRVEWTPYSLTRARTRIWSHYDATDIAGLGDNSALDNNQRIDLLVDRSGNGRHFYPSVRTVTSPQENVTPQVLKNGFANKDVLLFDGSNGTSARFCRMETANNGGGVTTEAGASGLFTAVPEHTNCRYAIFMVVKINKSNQTAPEPMRIFEHRRANAGGGTVEYLEIIGNGEVDLTPPVPHSAGRVCILPVCDSEGGGPAGATSVEDGAVDSTTSVAIITLLMTHNGASAAGDKDKSLFRVNGTQVDVFNCRATTGYSQTDFLGWGLNPSSGHENFNGFLMEMIVLRRDDNLDTTTTIPNALVQTYWTAEGGINAYTTYQGTSEMERIEGYLAHKWGLSHILPATHPHFYTSGPPVRTDTGAPTAAEIDDLINDPSPYLAGFDGSDGTLQWILNDPSTLVTKCEADFSAGSTTIYNTGAFATCPTSGVLDVLIGGGAVVGEYTITASTANTVTVTGNIGGPLDAGGAYGGPGSQVYNVRFRTDQASTTANHEGGIGAGVVASPTESAVYSVGPRVYGNVTAPAIASGANNGGRRALCIHRKVIDNGTSGYSVDEAATTAWAAASPNTLPLLASDTVEYSYIKPSVDSFANVYFPHFDATQAANVTVKGYTSAQSSGIPTRIVNHDIASSIAYCVASGKTSPLGVTNRPEFLFVGAFNAGGVANRVLNTQFKLALLSVTQANSGPRTLVNLAVSNRKLRKYTTVFSDPGTFSDGLVNATLFDASASYISSAGLFSEVFFTDGVRYVVYTASSDTVSLFKSTGSGKIPPRCRLMAAWRGRLVLAGDPDSPAQWHMSKQGDVRNWDFFPETLTAQSAVSGSTAQIGACPDIIRTIIPYNDDLLIFGCNSSIWRMTGDPMAGGQFDLVSDITGMAFGRPWCKDPQGVLYFFGSRGGVYRMAPGGVPDSISINKIESRLRSVNLSTHHVELCWNNIDDGLHVFVIAFNPAGTGYTKQKSWFWERRTGAWFEDTFGDTDIRIQPTSAMMLDSDTESGRTLVMGCEDGYIRKWDASCNHDDGGGVTIRPIDTSVVIGPIVKPAGARIFRIKGLYADLASDQDVLNYSVLTSMSPDEFQPPQATGQIRPGAPRQPAKGKGQYCYVRLHRTASDRSVTVVVDGSPTTYSGGSRWAIERLAVSAYPAGDA